MPIQLENGSAASPALQWTSDPDNGIFLSGTNQLTFSTAGSGRVRIDANGRLLLQQTSGFTSPSGSGICVRDGAIIVDRPPYSDFHVNKHGITIAGGGVLNADPGWGHQIITRTFFSNSNSTGPWVIFDLNRSAPGAGSVAVLHLYLYGRQASNNYRWHDEIVASVYNGTPTVLHTVNIQGSPPTRTYSVSGADLRVTFSAGSTLHYIDMLGIIMQETAL